MHEQVTITAKSSYVANLSKSGKYFFNYTITIGNNNAEPIQLLSRHWYITDANGHVKEVQGVGVVGKQPTIEPTTTFTYLSSVEIDTPVGSMHGLYHFIDHKNQHFSVPIKPFSLAIPNLVN